MSGFTQCYHTKYSKISMHRETLIDFLQIYVQISTIDTVQLCRTEIQRETVTIKTRISCEETKQFDRAERAVERYQINAHFSTTEIHEPFLPLVDINSRPIAKMARGFQCC